MTQTYSFPGPTNVTDQYHARKDLSGLVVKNSAGAIRTGVFPRHTGALVSSRADMQVDVGSFEVVADQFGGAIFLANDSTVQATITTAPGANSRIDVVYVKQNENAAPATDADNNRVIGVAAGTPAASPTKPAIPTGAVELATVLIPTGKTATNQSGVVITQTAQYTAAAGGTVLVRNLTELAAWTPGDGAQAYNLTTGELVWRSGGAWLGGTETGTWSPNTYYKNHASYQSIALTRRLGRARLMGVATLNQTVNFAANFAYVLGTVPAGWRAGPSTQMFRPCAVSPMNPGWHTSLTNGNVEFSLINAQTGTTDAWIISVDLEWVIGA